MSTEISLPRWLEDSYSLLWKNFKNKEFCREDAVKILQEKAGDRSIAVILSKLRKAGWLDIRLDPSDARRSLYFLKSRGEIFKNTFKITSKKLTRSDIEQILKKAADLIRTRVDYKFILILLFLKRISDKWELEFEQAYKEALEDGLSEEEAKKEAKSSTYHEFDLPEEFLWKHITKNVNALPETLSQSLKKIAELNPELKDVVDRADFIQFTTSKENFEILRQLVELFSEKKLHHVSPDVLGDAYEWVLRYFAPQKAKEGEVYTPREVIKLLIKALDPKPRQRVYDPACGSGGMLIAAYKHVEEANGKEEANKLFLYGQEANSTTYALCKMNLYIHDIRNPYIAYGDTLLSPKFKEGVEPKKFDIVIANPPWNQDGYGEDTIKKAEFWQKRFGHGFVTKQSADWAWIQHMLASAKENTGRVGIVIDNGCLFRGGKERAIRSKVIEDDLLECVILLPEKLFYNTGAPGAILIFRKNKPEKRKNKALFINASKEYEQHPEIRKLNRLGEKHIKKIVEAYNKFEDIKDFAKVVSHEEIRENDYNLNVTLYVFPEEKEEEIDVKKEWEELRQVENEIQKVEEKINEFLRAVR